MTITRVSAPDRVRAADAVVIGGGVAGLTAALHAEGSEIALLGKGAFGRTGSSVYAQGGVAVALAPDDSPERHADDTLLVGGGLADPAVVRSVTAEGPARMAELLALGTRFDRAEDGTVALGREAAHSRRRIVHAAGDATGAELVRALGEAVSRCSRIRTVEHTRALELVLEGGRVAGLLTADADGGTTLWATPAVVLATGGIGQLWTHTTNPLGSTGDGLAIAARAGARLANLEMVQFHPTALADGSNPMPLLTEALRGEGAVLVDGDGRRLMEGVHPDLELAPRDVVARAIWRVRRDGRQAYLDATQLAHRFERRFPTVLRLCLERGLDPRETPIPVAPAAHYHMGGVAVDRDGATSVSGLWACGEVAWTGLHGANRLASNSLLEAMVYGARVGAALAAARTTGPREVRLGRPSPEGPRRQATAEDGLGDAWRRLRAAMWEGVGLERTTAGLVRARRELDALDRQLRGGAGEIVDALLVARMTARAALVRTESRGAHFRADFPFPDPAWRQDLHFAGMDLVEPHPVRAALAG